MQAGINSAGNFRRYSGTAGRFGGKRYQTMKETETSSPGAIEEGRTIIKAEEMLTPGELAGYMKISTRQVLRLVAKGEIPYNKISERVIRFDWVNVKAWLQAHEKGGAI